MENEKTIKTGDTVDIKYIDYDDTITITLSDDKSDSLKGIISTYSPLGRSILNHKVGDNIIFSVDEKRVLNIEVLEIYKKEETIKEKKLIK